MVGVSAVMGSNISIIFITFLGRLTFHSGWQRWLLFVYRLHVFAVIPVTISNSFQVG